MTSKTRYGQLPRGFLRLTGIAAAISLSFPASASTDLGYGVRVTPLLNLTYSAAMRVDSQDDRLLANINGDDGNRNFDDGSLINNRIAALGELNFQRGDYGVFLRGSAFYDRAYRSSNDNDSPATVNKDGANDEFTKEARHFLGRRARMLDAYVYGTWYLGGTSLDVRVGDQVVSWGESLFFPNTSGAQAPADATKSNVPGTEVKDILLPIGQVYAQWGLTPDLGFAAYYQYEWNETELNPAGGYFSTADMLGPGATVFFVPGLAPFGLDRMPRGHDIRPSNSGQWGVSAKYWLAGRVELGLHHIRYHDKNPVGLTLENELFTVAPGMEIPLPVRYRVTFVDDIKLTGLSAATELLGTAVAAEVSYREGAGINVSAPDATPGRADVWQANLNFTRIILPTRFWDSLTLVGEVSWVGVDSVEAIESNGERYDTPTNGRDAAAYQALAQFNYKQVIPNWDFTLSLIHAHMFKGQSAVNGALGSLTGQGDKRYSAGFGFRYLNNLNLQLAYNGFHGTPDPVRRPLADRSYVSFSAQYSF
jgi:hypothetical protein